MHIKKNIILLLAFLLAACQAGASPTTPTATGTPLAADTPAPEVTSTPVPTGTPDYPEQGHGPAGFPPNVNPLTGLEVSNPALLERRPLIIKVSNLPRNVRPQWGLTLADIVYEYYTEEGTTRFSAVFLGTDAAQVGPIRSARFFDANLVRMYKGLFAYGSADKRVRDRLSNAEFASRLILEWEAGCPAMCRYDPNLYDSLVGNTSALSEYANKKGISNTRQGLDGMFFQMAPPAGGQPVTSVYPWYSAAIYNRWDYDPATGKYMRYADKENAVNNQPETYELLTDRNNNQPVTADTLVVLLMSHTFYSVNPEMVEMEFSGSGPAYVFRDGQAYQVRWQVQSGMVVSLVDADGNPFPFKPGQTWFEVMGKTSQVIQQENSWRFQMRFP
jgi:hypothetical protein